MNGDMNTVQNLKIFIVKSIHMNALPVKVLGLVKISKHMLLKLCGILIPTMMTISILVMISLKMNSICSLKTVIPMAINLFLNVNSSLVLFPMKTNGDQTTVQLDMDLFIVNVHIMLNGAKVLGAVMILNKSLLIPFLLWIPMEMEILMLLMLIQKPFHNY
jgi:hypothetical protein